MTRLRPEQVAGAILQAASLTTLDAQSHWFVRLIVYTGRNDFVRRYGDTGEDEFDARGGTIPQRLLLMNGELVQKQTEDGLFNAAPQIAQLAPDDRKAVEVAYLAVLTRRPTPEESAHFEARLEGTSGKDAEGPAHRPLLDPAQRDGILLEPLRPRRPGEATHDHSARDDDRPPRLPHARRAGLADAGRAPAGRAGRALARAGAVGHPALAGRRAEPARDVRPAPRDRHRRRDEGDRDRRQGASSSPRGSSGWPSRWARSPSSDRSSARRGTTSAGRT